MQIDLPQLRKHLHLASGLVMGAFIIGHFSNHALGLVSLGAMERLRETLSLVWRSAPGTVLLYGSILTHFLLAIDSLYRRHTLKMPFREGLRIALGLSLPFLIAVHVIATRVDYSLTGHAGGYTETLARMAQSPGTIARQSIALLVAWTHFCLGIWFWIRNRDWYQRVKMPLYTVAILLPVLALLGFSLGMRSIDYQPTPMWFRDRSSELAMLARITDGVYAFLTGAIGCVLVARAIPRSGRVRISYPDGGAVTVEAGTSVLEASRLASRPHLSVCGGRGRCSTCRVKVLAGIEGQPEPSGLERATLERIGAPGNVRLACQLRPEADITVSPVLKAAPHLRRAHALRENAGGRERQLAVLFCDLRDFTRLSEEKLPFDTMFLLNSYFEMIGEAVEQSGGVIDKFIGDGALIHFGLSDGYRTACIKAITAAVRISQGIDDLNRSFKGELKEPLRVAMGMHGGPAIIGRVGYGEISELTVVGDTVNTASRLEGVAKEYDAELAVSSDILDGAGMRVEAALKQEIALRGRAQPVIASIFTDARELSRFLYSSL
ncbi:adenylate/guanylate cyclase domain-containing protein [Gellertiella hungarica]|uniref:Adenylate cyclase n=1 Tax=Gellertiella hungarica TaxID=1572859 RepID=A0A7W6J5A8_9HYPH|nr:adenylate/guanylate cyclase domain-containing protein [Gellertiella hungarica]MBB4065039.1 adenylate cyclase [Gellertiella hungarica]